MTYKKCLSYFHRIEERGSGFRRMTDQMLDHGLDRPLLGTDTGYFQVTFPGPGENIDRLRVPEGRLVVTPAVEAQLNERQRRILAHALESGSVTRRWCVAELEVANDTAGRDLKSLVDMGLLLAKGRGRAVRYVLPPAESTDNRPTSPPNRPIGESPGTTPATGRSTRFRLKGAGKSSTNRQPDRRNRKPRKGGRSA